ncbi:MAG: hypothetical protein ACTHJ9_17415 [Rhodanobacter sp.]
MSREELKPSGCPFCDAALSDKDLHGYHKHPSNDCLLSGYEFDDIATWNRRAQGVARSDANCSKCGTELAGDGSRCGVCGAQDVARAPEEGNEWVQCRHCGSMCQGEMSDEELAKLRAADAWETWQARAALATTPDEGTETPDIVGFCELIDAYQSAQKTGADDESGCARIALIRAYRAALATAPKMSEAVRDVLFEDDGEPYPRWFE